MPHFIVKARSGALQVTPLNSIGLTLFPLVPASGLSWTLFY